MPCEDCDRPRRWTGLETYAAPGTYLRDLECCQGVLMDCDEYHEGWDPTVVYPPCRFNPARCPTCDGTGDAPPMMAEALKRDDCEDCRGTGWKDGDWQWPTPADELEPVET